MRIIFYQNMKANILHITDKYSYGGVETIVYKLIETFNSENVELNYLFLRDLKNKEHIINSNIFIKNYSKISFLQPLFEINQLLNLKKVKILHTHHRKGFYLSLIISFFRKDLIYIHHEHSDIVPNNPIYSNACKLAQKRGFRFIAVSKFLAKSLEKKAEIETSNITILPNFVDLQYFKQASFLEKDNARSFYHLNKHTYIIGFAGRIIERKGWLDFLNACKMLDDDGINFSALIAGDGPDLGKLKETIVTLKLERKIKLLGYCSDMRNFYASLDCFVIPSHWEGLPMSQLEVMSSGIPMISSNGPGLDEVCTDNFDCLYFEVKNHKNLYSKLIKIQKNSKLKEELSLNALNTVLEYSLKKYLYQLDVIYKVLLNNSPA